MINFDLSSFMFSYWALRSLRQEFSGQLVNEVGQLLPDYERTRLIQILGHADKQCQSLGLQSAEHRFQRISAILRTQVVSYAWAVIELNTLIEAIDDDARFERFHHYDGAKGRLLLTVQGDWAATIAAFPSTLKEIEDAIDCYALTRNTASVFHLMRIAEYGLRSLARERKVVFPKKPLEWAVWSEIIREIQKSADKQWDNAPSGAAKDAALHFYRGAVGQFFGFKDQYRNAVSHVRVRYDEHQALRVVSQVRDFMNELSKKINEKTKTPIRKWP